jgi:tRNA-splicing ligase RtcB (3'-phosphate/5'-hydroxy nucleic acid ligase)
MRQITGKTLIEWGLKPGPWFPRALEAAQAALADGLDEAGARGAALACAPKPVAEMGLRKQGEVAHFVNAEPESPEELANIELVERHMTELMRVPTIVAGAVMPDACPSGYAPGTIPVGGVIAAKEAIHPGMHSADICCSVALTVFDRDADAKKILDAGMRLSHFGGGGRTYSHDMRPSNGVMEDFEGNRFLRMMTDAAIRHFGTQGDGNHFFFVGRVKSSGQIALVTHHGSRRPGALLYKAGMDCAENWRRQISPETSAHNAWIPSETEEGAAYWDALQIIRRWTKANHFAIHDAVGEALGYKAKDRFWNEHNFVFRKSDGLFYHAKGATPAFPYFAADATELTLIPLNMAEPILAVRGKNAESGLGFSPHGAGRNLSRSAYMRANAGMTPEEMIAEQAPGVDVRYFCGIPDISELPNAYKKAASVRRQIERFDLAEIVDEIMPLGNIMAGNWQQNAPWRTKRDKTSLEN